MDLFQTLGTIELVVMAILLALFGQKKAVLFLYVWFGAVSGASAATLFVMACAGAISTPPSANNMAIAVLTFLNVGALWTVHMFAAGKLSETLR